MADRPILVVEDDETVNQAIQASLSRGGYLVQTADCCSAGLARALEQAPALLVLDIGLPDGSGWTLLENIRRALPGKHFPVIVVSSSRVTRGELRAYAVDRFLPKPFDMAYLVDTVQELLSNSHRDR